MHFWMVFLNETQQSNSKIMFIRSSVEERMRVACVWLRKQTAVRNKSKNALQRERLTVHGVTSVLVP